MASYPVFVRDGLTGSQIACTASQRARRLGWVNQGDHGARAWNRCRRHRTVAAPELFAEIYRRHRVAITAYATGRVKGHRIEDVVAEVFVAAFKSRRNYDLGEANCLPWLYGIACNVARNEYRWWQRHKLNKVPLEVAHVFANFADEVVDRVDAEALLAHISPTIIDLRDEERLSLELLADGLTYSEIATQLDCEVGTVKSRISRARTKILSATEGTDQ